MKYQSMRRYRQKLVDMTREIDEYVHEKGALYWTFIHLRHEVNPEAQDKEVKEKRMKYPPEDIIGYYQDLLEEIDRVDEKMAFTEAQLGISNFKERKERQKKFVDLLSKLYICKDFNQMPDEIEKAYMLNQDGNPVTYQYQVQTKFQLGFEPEWIQKFYTDRKEEYERQEEEMKRRMNLCEIDFTPKYQTEYPLWDNIQFYFQQ